MSFLGKVEDWLIRRTLQPVYVGQTVEPPSDDGAWALAVFLLLLVASAVTCGQCLAR
jgi:hypothetical protein